MKELSSDTAGDLFLGSAARAATRGIKVNEGDYYVGGVLFCGVCGRPKTKKNDYLDCYIRVDCLCDEERKEKERIRKEKALLEDRVIENRAAYKRLCGEEAYVRFDGEEFSPGGAEAACFEYARNFGEMEKNNTGLLLTGPSGVGKTHLSRCVATYLIERGRSALWFDLCSLAEKLIPSARNQDVGFYEKILRTTDLVVFDDLGRERRNDYMDSAVIRAIDLRYDAGKPAVFVTSYDEERLKKPRDGHEDALFSRVLEMSVSVRVEGPNRRILRHNEKTKRFKEMIGGSANI